MSIVDKAKEALSDVAHKTEGLRGTVGGAMETAIDKVADAADGATKGKYSDKIDKVRDLADKLDTDTDTDTDTAAAAATDQPDAEDATGTDDTVS